MNKSKQARRLLKLAEVIEQQEGHFDMDSWIDVRGDSDTSSVERLFSLIDLKKPVSCGMTACMGGWAVLTWPKEAQAIGGAIEDAAAEILGYGSDNYSGLGDLFLSGAPWQTTEGAAAELRRRAVKIILDL